VKKEELVIRWMNHLLSSCTLYKDKQNPNLFYYVLDNKVKFIKNDETRVVDIEYQSVWAKSRELFYSNAHDFYYYLECWVKSNNWKDYSVYPSSDLDYFKKEMELV